MRRGFAIFLIAAFVSLVVVAYSQEQRGDGATSPAPVPSLEGQELAAALQEVGDDFELSSSEENSDQPEGTIISQSPGPGTNAEQGRTVSVVVSAGPETARLPIVVGKTRDEAERALTTAGFKFEVVTEESPEEDVGKVLEQSPSAGDIEKDSVISITVGGGCAPGEASGPVRCYVLAEDLAGSLTVEVPSGWGILTGTDSEMVDNNWSDFVGESISSSITTAPNLDAWHNSDQEATGTYIVASRTLARAHANDELIYSGPLAGMGTSCEAGAREGFDRPPYSGSVQVWNNCGGKGTTFFTVAAAPQDRECVIVLQVGIGREEDRQAAQHILDTFDADCSRVS